MRKPREIRDGLRSCLWTYLLKKDTLTHGLHLLHPWSTCEAGNYVLIKVEEMVFLSRQNSLCPPSSLFQPWSSLGWTLRVLMPSLGKNIGVCTCKKLQTDSNSACPTPMSSSANVNKNSFSSSAPPMELFLGPHVIHGISAAFGFCSVICTEAAWGASKCAGAHFWSLPNCLIKTME